MSSVHVPCGRKMMTADIDEKNLLGVFSSALPAPSADPFAEVENALDNPIGSPKLEELARGKRTVTLIASDHTRPVPSRFIIPAMLRRIRKGSPDAEITILIATGCHRETSREELINKFGEEIVENEKIIVHDCSKENELCKLGTLPSGGELIINKNAVEADLLISEGFIEPHFFAGFSGGRKSVLPGIAARNTVLANHCSEFIQHPCSRTGILENNPIHNDMVFAANAAKLAFIVNVVIDHDKKIVRAFAGDHEKAHRTGCDFLQSICKVRVPEADIVITSNGGYPLDQNIYQSVKGMTAGEAVCKPGGVIIISAGCSDGHGGEAFCKVLTEAESAHSLWKQLQPVPRDQTTPDQWQFQILARILTRFHVILVTDSCDHGMIRNMKMQAASSLEEALAMARAIMGKDAAVAVIPDGVSVVAEKLS